MKDSYSLSCTQNRTSLQTHLLLPGRARMENRPVRLKLAELQQLRVTELKRLMKALQVSPDGLLEGRL